LLIHVDPNDRKKQLASFSVIDSLISTHSPQHLPAALLATDGTMNTDFDGNPSKKRIFHG